MTNLNHIPPLKKDDQSKHVETAVLEKYQRLARKCLHDFVAFHETLETEMQHMIAGNEKGQSIDRELLEKMVTVKEKYLNMMHGFKVYDDDQERHALIVFADAVQDLLAFMHKRQRH